MNVSNCKIGKRKVSLWKLKTQVRFRLWKPLHQLYAFLEPIPPRGGLNMLIRITADGQKPLEVAAKSIQASNVCEEKQVRPRAYRSWTKLTNYTPSPPKLINITIKWSGKAGGGGGGRRRPVFSTLAKLWTFVCSVTWKTNICKQNEISRQWSSVEGDDEKSWLNVLTNETIKIDLIYAV